jgi:phage-related protein
LHQALRSYVSKTVQARIEFSIYTRLADSVLIFHAFVKKTQKTPPQEIALAQKRLKEMLDEES